MLKFVYIREPYASQIMLGKKLLETRNRNDLKHIDDAIIVTPAKNGNHARCVGFISLSRPEKVTTYERWKELQPYHLVDESSPYGWHEDTKVKWVYPIKTSFPLDESILYKELIEYHGRQWGMIKDEKPTQFVDRIPLEKKYGITTKTLRDMLEDANIRRKLAKEKGCFWW